MTLIDVVLHPDRYLSALVQSYGAWIYLMLFAIVFCETGLVITPMLPGDSLLFVAGALAAAGGMNMPLLVLVLSLAAILGDTLNYAVGRWAGPRVFHNDTRWLNRRHLAHAQAFYERHGGKTIILSRFVPIVRTYAPFVAGIGAMEYRRFLAYNVLGAVLWVVTVGYAGYFFGNVAWVQRNLTAVILGIVALSVLPAVVEVLRQRSRA